MLSLSLLYVLQTTTCRCFGYSEYSGRFPAHSWKILPSQLRTSQIRAFTLPCEVGNKTCSQFGKTSQFPFGHECSISKIALSKMAPRSTCLASLASKGSCQNKCLYSKKIFFYINVFFLLLYLPTFLIYKFHSQH